MHQIKRVAVLTSGGDAPGMNAAIRAIVLAAHHHSVECIGFYHGYNGLLMNDGVKLEPNHVENIIQQGGTILKSARCQEMLTENGVKQVVNTLRKNVIDALIVIGGDGSFNGLLAISKYWDGQVIGVPGTIDNDLDGTDFTIGFSTAINTAINAIDKIRDTANAFDRVFIVELMGRNSGHIAFNVGVACAAEEIISFENFSHENEQEKLIQLANDIKLLQADKNRSYLIVLAENLWPGGAVKLSKQLNSNTGIDSAACILGHIQRGGAPAAKDRILATKIGVATISALIEGENKIMIGERNNDICFVDLHLAIQHNKMVNESLVAAHENILALTVR